MPGVDGVGRLADGQRVYFFLPRVPFGAMAETTVVQASLLVPLPDDIDDATAAAAADPGMSSWAALVGRARFAPGESVLVQGATGASGRLAIAIAKHLGAERVVATGRTAASVAPLLALGADAVIALDQPPDDFAAAVRVQLERGIDVVLDYLWGSPAAQLLAALTARGIPPRRIRYVQIGSIAGEILPFPASFLRSAQLELLGSGIGSVPTERLVAAIAGLMQAFVPARMHVAFETFPLDEVASVWNRSSDRRVVFTR